MRSLSDPDLLCQRHSLVAACMYLSGQTPLENSLWLDTNLIEPSSTSIFYGLLSFGLISSVLNRHPYTAFSLGLILCGLKLDIRT
jgi:hypothetical protein